MVSLIWAQAANGVIGKDGTLPWRLPEDMVRFRALTIGSTVLMGRATWDSLPDKARPLVDRRNLVLTAQQGWSARGAIRVASIEAGIAQAEGALWVIGGSRVYQAALPFAKRVVVTELEESFDGDTYAPTLDAGWSVLGREPAADWATSSTGLRYRVITYERDGAPRDTVGA
jgi:dihydrofolate reductase